MIEPKKKKCKGRNKAKGFPGCDDFFIPFRYGLCQSCFKEWCYSTGEGQEYIRKMVIPKAKLDVKKKEKAKTKALREKLKTLGQYEAEAKKAFQKWIRNRDSDKNCISCDTAASDIWDGGHFYKAEIYSGLIFDERNCHKQCGKCNRFLGGNENNYRLGLIKRYGMPFVLQLDADAIRLRNYKYTKAELVDIKETYRKKLRDLAS